MSTEREVVYAVTDEFGFQPQYLRREFDKSKVRFLRCDIGMADLPSYVVSSDGYAAWPKGNVIEVHAGTETRQLMHVCEDVVKVGEANLSPGDRIEVIAEREWRECGVLETLDDGVIVRGLVEDSEVSVPDHCLVKVVNN